MREVGLAKINGVLKGYPKRCWRLETLMLAEALEHNHDSGRWHGLISLLGILTKMGATKPLDHLAQGVYALGQCEHLISI
jgi:hypothetical protein